MNNIIASNQFGLFDASNVLGGQAIGTQGGRYTVNAATGNLVLQHQDELLMGLGLGTSALRTYNSLGQFDGDNDDGFRFGVYRRLKAINAGVSVTLERADGAEQVFSFDGSHYVSTEGSGAHDVIRQDGVNWVFEGDEGAYEETFNAIGQLVKTLDRDGNEVSYQYDGNGHIQSITQHNEAGSSDDETLSFVYSGDLLQRIEVQTRDSAGNLNPLQTRVSYTYEAYGSGSPQKQRLKTVSIDLTPDNSADSEVYVTSYDYDGDSTRIERVTSGEGHTVNFTYVQVGSEYRIRTVVEGSQGALSFFYGDEDAGATIPVNQTRVTDVFGNKTFYTFNDTPGDAREGYLTELTSESADGSEVITTGYVYDAEGNLTSVTNGENETSEYRYDANGNLIEQQDALGNAIKYRYNADNQLIAKSVFLIPDMDGIDNATVEPGEPLTERLIYDSEGHLIYSVSAEGRVTAFDYTSQGLLQREILFDKLFDLTGFEDDASDIPQSTLDNFISTYGDRSQTQVTDYVYDVRGQLAKTITYGEINADGSPDDTDTDGDANTSSITYFFYNQWGWLLKTVKPNFHDDEDFSKTPGDENTLDAHSVLYTYDGAGRLLSTQTRISSSETRLTTNVFDDANRQVTTTLNNGLQTLQTFDAAGKLISEQQLDTSDVGLGTTHYFYDQEGKLIRVTGPTGEKVFNLYDAHDRLVGTVDAGGFLTETQYDDAGRATQTIQYTTAVNPTLLETADIPIENVDIETIRPAAHADDRETQLEYDEAGRLVKTLVKDIDSGDYEEIYAYDGAHRLASTTRVDITAESFELLPFELSGNAGVYTLDFKLSLLEEYQVFVQVGAGAEIKLTSATQEFIHVLGNLSDGSHSLSITVKHQNGSIISQGHSTIHVDDVSISSQSQSMVLRDVNVSTEARVTRLVYDNDGHTLRTYDAEGFVTETFRDGVGRVIQTRRYANKVSGPLGYWRLNSDSEIINSAGGANGTVTGSTEVALGVADGDRTGIQLTHRDWEQGVRLAQDGSLSPQEGTALISFKWDGVTGARALFSQLGGVSVWVTNGELSLGQNIVSQNRQTPKTKASDKYMLTANEWYTAAVTYTLDGEMSLYVINDNGEAELIQTLAKVNVLSGISNQAFQLGSFDRSQSTDFDSQGNARSREPFANAFGGMIDEFTLYEGHLSLEEFSHLMTSGGQSQIGVPTISAEDKVTKNYFDGRGLLRASMNEERVLTEYFYDLNGQLLSTKTYANTILDGSHDISGLSLTDALAEAQGGAGQFRTSSMQYNEAGEVIKTVDTFNTETHFQYNAIGQVIETKTGVADTDESEKRETFQAFDIQGRLVRELTPQGVKALRAALVGVTNPDDIETITDNHYAQFGISYEYDKAGRLLSKSTPEGDNGTPNKTIYYYDSRSNLTHTIDGAGNVAVMSYNRFGEVASSTRYHDVLSSSDLAALYSERAGEAGSVLGSLQTRLDALGNESKNQVETITYTQRGLVDTVTDGEGFETRHSYNRFGDLNTITRVIKQAVGGPSPTPEETRSSYFETDKRGLQTLVLKTKDSDVGVVATEYDAFGRVIKTIDALGKITLIDYHEATHHGRKVSTILPTGSRSSIEMDAFGQTKLITDALDQQTQYTYNDSTRQFTVETPEGVTVTTTMNRHGQTVEVDNQDGNTRTVFEYDDNGQLTKTQQVDRSDGSVMTETGNQFDDAGRLQFSIDGEGRKVQFIYDAANRVTQQIVDPDGLALTTTTTYNGLSQIVTVTDSNGIVTETEYDNRGLVIAQVVEPSSLHLRTEMFYDGEGHLIETREGDNTNPSQRVTQYQYDSDGRQVKSIVGPGGLEITTQTDYNQRNEVIAITDAEGQLTRMVYDADGNLRFSIAADGSVTESIYDDNKNVIETIAYAEKVTIPAVFLTLNAEQVSGYLNTTHSHNQHLYNIYDEDQRLVFSVNHQGEVTQLQYDAAGRVTRTIVFDKAINPATAKTESAILTELTTTLGYNLSDDSNFDVDNSRVVHTRYDAAGRVQYTLTEISDANCH